MLLEEPSTITMDELGKGLRELMAKRNLQGVDLAASVGISPNALSAILTGKSNPRYATFARLRDRVAATPEEAAALTAAFECAPFVMPEEQAGKLEEPAAVLGHPIDERAASYLDAKAHSIDFRNDIQRVLDEAKIPYNRDFVFEHSGRKVTCDFVTRAAKNRIAIEAKYALNREWDLVLGSCIRIRQKLPAQAVVVVVPYHNAMSIEAKKDFAQVDIPVVKIDELTATLRELGA